MAGPVAINGGITNPPSPAAPTLDPHVVLEYLAQLLVDTLGATRGDLEATLQSSLRLPDTLQLCSRFASEPQTALYIQQESLEQTDGSDELNGISLIMPAHGHADQAFRTVLP